MLREAHHAAEGWICSRNLALVVKRYKAARDAFEDALGIGQIWSPGAEFIAGTCEFP
jgi:hypothetical protein